MWNSLVAGRHLDLQPEIQFLPKSVSPYSPEMCLQKNRLQLGFPFFPNFQLPEKRKIFKKFGKFPRKFPSNFSRAKLFCLFFWFSAFQTSFLAFCYVVLTNLVSIFQFFRQIKKKIFISEAFCLKNFANFEK